MALRHLKDRLIPPKLPGEPALSEDNLHVAGLRKLFSPLSVSGDLQLNRPLVLLAFSNRSGSTHLGQLLASAPDLYGFREDLNHQTARRRQEEGGRSDFTRYVAHIVTLGEKPGAGFGLKASAQQLRLVQMAGIDNAFSSTSVIRIRRRDRVAQAVSLWMAHRTQQWTSRQDARDVALTYDYRDLRRHLKSIQAAESAIDLVLAVLPYPVKNVEYETLCKAPEQVVASVRAGLGLPARSEIPQGWTERQNSATKSELVARFRADLARNWSLHGDQSTRDMKTEFGSST